MTRQPAVISGAWELAIMKIRYLLLVCLAACSNGGGGAGDVVVPPPVVIQSPGGIWNGTRPNGTDIIVLISETGELRIVDPFGNLGFGQVQVANETEISSRHRLVAPFGGSLIDGSESADCSFDGTLQERQTIDYEIECITSLGTVLGGPTSLTYDPLYDMESSIARIAGSYDSQGDIMTIDVNGAIFMQGSQTGCVVNGQVSLIDTEWNLYNVGMTTENCQGPFAPLNGANWQGLGTVLTDPGVDVVLVGFIADVNGQTVALSLALPRI